MTHPDLPHLWKKKTKQKKLFLMEGCITSSPSHHHTVCLPLFSFQSWTCLFCDLPAPSPHPTRGWGARQPPLAVPACTASDSSSRSQWPMHQTLVAFQLSATAHRRSPISLHRAQNNDCCLKKRSEFIQSALFVKILMLWIGCLLSVLLFPVGLRITKCFLSKSPRNLSLAAVVGNRASMHSILIYISYTSTYIYINHINYSAIS